MKLPFKGARIMKPTEVPRAGDFSRWAESKRDDWVYISPNNTRLIGLPIATIRTRCGQDGMQFATHRSE